MKKHSSGYQGLYLAIVLLSKNAFPGRLNINQTRAWVEKHPERSIEILAAFDAATVKLNSVLNGPVHFSPKEAAIFRNIYELKQLLPQGYSLATLQQLNQSRGLATLLQLRGTMSILNTMMMRGEQGNKRDPFLSYHTGLMDEEARFVGTLVHGMEEYLIHYGAGALPDPEVMRRRFSDAFVEVLAFERQNPLYDAVANSSRLDWIRGWQYFSEEFIRDNT